MSYRIHTAMGWGITVPRFEELCKLPKHEFGVGEAMDDWASGISTPLDIPVEVWREHFNRREGSPPFFYHSLAGEEDRAGRRLLTANQTGSDLYTYAFDTDSKHVNHLIFFPSGYYGEKWYRADDDLDYALLYRWRDGCNTGYDPTPEDKVRFVPYAPYPWSNFVMKADGTPVKWDESMMLQRHPELVAAVPAEIRWYLTTLGVMDDAGVNELRPIVAEWWC